MAESTRQGTGTVIEYRYYSVRQGTCEFLGPALAGTGYERATELREGLGLGIDAGGTYTDAVLYDFGTRRVLETAKALTTHVNPALGIGHALDSLSRNHFALVRRVSLATTFATNAIVEGKGRRVGLLLAGYDRYDLARIRHRPLRALKGYHDVTGTLIEDLDELEVETAVKELVGEGVEAFAVTAHGACRNPEHEIEIKAIARRISSLPIVMGHELTNELDCILRAGTTALNARISPLIVELCRAVEEQLEKCGIATPLTIVRADGSLMNSVEACEKPIEMILSGPAASIQGALELSGLDSALIVDMGGTTSDIARTMRGRPVMSSRGAVIGDERTTVRTLKSSSIGIGGDSEIWIEHGEIRVGPRRILPLCHASSMDPRVRARHAEVSASRLAEIGIMHPAQVYFLVTEPEDKNWLEPRERAILDALREGPLNILDLARALDFPFLSCIPLRRLEDFGYVIRAGFTPTDLVHVEGSFVRWDAEAANEALAAVAARLGVGLKACSDKVRSAMTEMLAKALLVEGSAESGPTLRQTDPVGGGFGDHFWKAAVTGKSNGAFLYSIRLTLPLIGVGAPIEAFLPDVAARFDTRAVIPDHADTAGAVGAVISAVTEELELLIRPGPNGYAVFGPDFKRNFGELHVAKEAALELALAGIVRKAEAGGIRDSLVEITLEDEIVEIALGKLYMETKIHASARALV
jgi:N-methylhydantoinase A/oxoprolinase/acetone carboxylase beta subunit